MKKRVLTLFLALLTALTLAVPVWAEQQPGDAFVYDMAGILSEEDNAYLEAMADQISWRHNCAVYIITVNDYTPTTSTTPPPPSSTASTATPPWASATTARASSSC